MAFVPVPGGAEAVLHFQLDGQEVQNTLWFVSELGVVSSTDCFNLADALATWCASSLMLQLPQAVSANYVSVRAQDVEGGPGADIGMGGTLGGIVDDPLPNEVTVAISFRTAGTGRGSRGRNYIPALPRSNVTGNIVDSALLASIRTVYEGLNTAIEATNFLHIIAHRFSGYTIVDGKKVPTPLVTGVALPVASYIFADNVVDAQRRRGPGRGR